MPTNFEFKATTNCLETLEKKLLLLQPKFIGTDHQIDTYFNSTIGRLKLREGNIENALIHYVREDNNTAKQSTVLLYQHQPNATLKQILTLANRIKIIVDKTRKIYFINNVKFHLDTVQKLGTFIEVEAIDMDNTYSLDDLKNQCNYYIEYFNILPQQFCYNSYSDMLLQNLIN